MKTTLYCSDMGRDIHYHGGKQMAGTCLQTLELVKKSPDGVIKEDHIAMLVIGFRCIQNLFFLVITQKERYVEESKGHSLQSER